MYKPSYHPQKINRDGILPLLLMTFYKALNRTLQGWVWNVKFCPKYKYREFNYNTERCLWSLLFPLRHTPNPLFFSNFIGASHWSVSSWKSLTELNPRLGANTEIKPNLQKYWRKEIIIIYIRNPIARDLFPGLIFFHCIWISFKWAIQSIDCIFTNGINKKY